MNTTTPKEIRIDADKVMDVRAIPCSIKHGAIIRTWQELAVGDYFFLRNDHDPVRLRDQFNAQWPGTFTWEYLVQGPDEFRIRITRLYATSMKTVAAPDCCGGH